MMSASMTARTGRGIQRGVKEAVDIVDAKPIVLIET